MKVALLSDIHLEFQPYDYELPNADVLLLPGDIFSALVDQKDIIAFFQRCYNKYGVENVLFIEGNHEGYGGDWNDLGHPRICKEIGDIVFIGATLWSGEGSQVTYAAFLNDARQIINFTWKKMYEEHLKDEEFIRKKLDYYHLTHKCVVFTHHLPSYECVDEIYRTPQNDQTTNKGFYVDEEDLIFKYNPVVWCYGHTHSGADFQLGKTRMLCNPRGYPVGAGADENEQFNPMLTFEV